MNRTPRQTHPTAGTHGATPVTTSAQLMRVIRGGRQAAARILAPIPGHDAEKWIAHAIMSPRDQELAPAAVGEAAGVDVRQAAGNAHQERGGLDIVRDDADDAAIAVIGAESFLAGTTRRPRGKAGVFIRRPAGGLVRIDPEHHGNSGTESVAGDVDCRAAYTPATRGAIAMFKQLSELVRSNRPLPWSLWDVKRRRPALKVTGTACVARSTRTLDRLWLPSPVKRG